MFLARLLFVVLSGVTAVLAFQSLEQSSAFGPVTAVADRLRVGGQVDRAALARASDAVERMEARGVCRSDLIEAALAVELAVARGTGGELDRPDRARRLDGFLRHAIGCSPANGRYWARAALASIAARRDPAEAAAFLRQSASLSPAEYGALSLRLAAWRRLPPETVGTMRGAYAQDVRAALSAAKPEHLAKMLDPADQALRREARELAPLLSPERRQALEDAGLGWIFDAPSS